MAILVPQIFGTICVIVFELFSFDHTTQAHTHKHAHKQMKTYLPGGGRKSLSLNKLIIDFRNLSTGGFMSYLHIIKLQY